MAFGMMPFTRANLSALKGVIRDQFPDLKSSHVDEAIAFGFGFDTYAAMLPVLDLADATSVMTAQLMPEWFALRLHQLGYEVERYRTLQQTLWAPPLPETRPAAARRLDASRELFKPRPANDG